MLESDEGGRNMFERFTDKARRTVVLAQEEARQLRHDHIGTEHLLLGLLRESDGAAATALTSLGISLDATRERVAAAGAVEPGRSGEMTAGHIPFTPQAKRTLELALREALQLGHDYIGTGHILLGIVRDPGCQGASILSELGSDQAAIRERVIELRPPSQPRPASIHRVRPSESTRWTESLTARLTALEYFAGMTPDTAVLDFQLARLRQEKESAIDAKDFQLAEALSDAENDLLADRNRRTSQWSQRASLAAQLGHLQAEVDCLRTILREHGLDAPDEVS
jgi:hypothetical protein